MTNGTQCVICFRFGHIRPSEGKSAVEAQAIIRIPVVNTNAVLCTSGSVHVRCVVL